MRPFTSLRALSVSLLVSLVSAQLGIEVTKEADCSRKTQDGDKISVNYRGSLQSDGSVFDSSYKRNQPFSFTLGTGQVIKGWDQGLQGMCIGEARKLTIPAYLAYGTEGTGPIPGGATLVFETELVGIEGVEVEAAPERPTLPDSSAETSDELADKPESAPASSTSDEDILETSAAIAGTTLAQPTSGKASPMDNEDSGECHLLGPYALLVQAALGLLAVSSLVVKRLRESPRRPFKIWFFDVSKQVFGSVLLHLANILMSMLSSGALDVAAKTKATPHAAGADEDGNEPNPCSFYLLNLAIDTTLGIPVLVLLLKVLHRAFAHTPMANPPESIRSGNYGYPPRATWWLKQSLIYFLGLLGMKFCVFILFALVPWIAWVGDWALRWTEGNEALQITFVMFVFPLIMNGLQYWIIDGYIKDPAGAESGYTAAAADDSDDSDDEAWMERRRGTRDLDDEEDSDVAAAASGPLKEANPTAVPVRQGGADYDPVRDGEQGGSGREGKERRR
ncbi:FK506-binding protein 2 precursor [Massariosphaeria phaeospora]|uniref:peptidylprolyl isomerase n=1 Tax=Massariosphaeria phaeospora TaxID=100035 RepID=A0A7C8IEQ0_9PLEO|nr:FK506-binding protein 2 precursor [Massariosphaeria phaeospora]